MLWTKRKEYLSQYEHTSINQHGHRYKRGVPKPISMATLSCPVNDPKRVADMQTLILLSHHLDLPVRYDFSVDPHIAYIEVIGAEAL